MRRHRKYVAHEPIFLNLHVWRTVPPGVCPVVAFLPAGGYQCSFTCGSRLHSRADCGLEDPSLPRPHRSRRVSKPIAARFRFGSLQTAVSKAIRRSTSSTPGLCRACSPPIQHYRFPGAMFGCGPPATGQTAVCRSESHGNWITGAVMLNIRGRHSVVKASMTHGSPPPGDAPYPPRDARGRD